MCVISDQNYIQCNLIDTIFKGTGKLKCIIRKSGYPTYYPTKSYQEKKKKKKHPEERITQNRINDVPLYTLLPLYVDLQSLFGLKKSLNFIFWYAQQILFGHLDAIQKSRQFSLFISFVVVSWLLVIHMLSVLVLPSPSCATKEKPAFLFSSCQT